MYKSVAKFADIIYLFFFFFFFNDTATTEIYTLSLHDALRSEAGQAGEGTRWMPWYQGPKKGVVRLRKASGSCQTSLAGDTRMGQPVSIKSGHRQPNT